ncbi:membrane metallo-endopeptidase-like 1 isoform X2 [Amblyomma americanum]
MLSAVMALISESCIGGKMRDCDDVPEPSFPMPKIEPEASFAWLSRGRRLQEEPAVKCGNMGGQRTLWSKNAVVIVGFTVAVTVALPLSVLSLLDQKKDSTDVPIHRLLVPSLKLCDTKECEFVSGLYRNTLPQPCTDFYEYVCARWKKGDDSFSTSVINQRNNEITESVIAVLRDMLVPPCDQTAVQKAAGLFQSCVALSNPNGSSSQDPRADILRFLAEHGATLGPQSAVGAWYSFLDFSLVYGLPTLVDVQFGRLSHDTQHTQVVLGMRPDFTYKHLRNETVIVNHLKWLEMEDKLIPATSSVIKIMERYLVLVSEAITTNDEPEQSNINVHALAKLEEAITSRTGQGWNGYMKNISDGFLPGDHNVVFLNNRIKNFLRKLFRSVDENRLALWISFDVSWQLRQMTHMAMPGTHLEEKLKLYHVQMRRPFLRHQKCLIYTSTVMNSATYSAYYHPVVTKDVLSKAIDTVSSVRVSLRTKITESRWLDEGMKKDMLEQLGSMKQLIGYPSGTQDEESLNSFYASFEDTGVSFIMSWLSASRSRTRRALSFKSEEDTIVALNEDMSRVNGKYAPTRNTIVIGLGLLMPPFFDTVPSIDYASMGHFAAHEMVHAFYELHTSRTNQKYLTSKEEYQKRLKCIRDAYLLPNDKFSSSNCAKNPEIVADFGALPVAYDAYVLQKNRTNSPLRLHSLPEMSDEQLFFTAFCYMWCSNLPPSHRYPEFKARCNSLVKNMPEFSTAFNCPAGSPMNPALKCTFW